ncbi:MAG: FliH/SctL family protein [Pseudobdellovibrionaceae bacterium]
MSKSVLTYHPPKFELGTAEQAKSYLEQRRSKSTDFRMSDVIRVQTGVEKVEASQVEDDVERKVLEKLKEVQESAYQEAYQLGLDEGKHEAYQKTTAEINAKLSQLDQLIESMKNIKTELMSQNENHLVQLAFHMAKRLAHIESKTDVAVIRSVIRDAVEKAQVEEEVTVQVSPSQIEFLETLKTETAREFEFMKRVKLEPVDSITPGGCVVITNYGVIDSQFEERVNKLWEGIAENLPGIKDKISSP